ncbi:MAG TPA: hypothetical protein VJ865_02415 [Gemmatimonadaceae bacterium]|nr:hypothetical protein [Gemmatimonadaceae bacterium]
MKYVIETYGCQMNVHDSERMAGLLEAAGYDRAVNDADADLVVINTCSVRARVGSLALTSDVPVISTVSWGRTVVISPIPVSTMNPLRFWNCTRGLTRIESGP